MTSVAALALADIHARGTVAERGDGKLALSVADPAIVESLGVKICVKVAPLSLDRQIPCWNPLT